MKKYFKIIPLVFVLCGQAYSNSTLSFTTLADDSVDQVWKELSKLGLQRWDAYHPLLPKPATPAKFAVVTKNKRVVAYFDEEDGIGGSTYVFKLTEGDAKFSISFSWDGILYSTPNLGTVAKARQLVTEIGPTYQFVCKNQNVAYPDFQSCSQFYWVRALANEIAHRL